MPNQKEKKTLFAEERPSAWKDLPDIDLYMDQVISYMQRQHLGLKINENLTPAMVNNYVKQKVMPKPTGKKYNKEHLSLLTIICVLKQVLPISEVKKLLDYKIEKDCTEQVYENHRNILDREYLSIVNQIGENLSKEDTIDLIMELAISSYAQKLASESLMQSLIEESSEK